MKSRGDFKLLGTTLDDSAGEAFDKVARVLGLSYPGGPEIEKLAQKFTVHSSQLTVKLPRPMIGSKDYNFSFSGLKTAVVNKVNSTPQHHLVRDKQLAVNKKTAIADEFQKAVVDVLVKKTLKACNQYNCKSMVIGGGVSANVLLCSQMTDHASRLGIKVYFPSKNLAVDNAAMIATAAYYIKDKIDPLKISAKPNLHF